jgi:hypothetical protein
MGFGTCRSAESYADAQHRCRHRGGRSEPPVDGHGRTTCRSEPPPCAMKPRTRKSRPQAASTSSCTTVGEDSFGSAEPNFLAAAMGSRESPRDRQPPPAIDRQDYDGPEHPGDHVRRHERAGAILSPLMYITSPAPRGTGSFSPHRDPLVRAPGPDLRDVGLIDLPDAGVSVLAGVRRVRPADVSPTRRSRR